MNLTSRPVSPDVLLGAYLVSHLQHRCENCGTSETPQWRKGWYEAILNRSVVLCNACGVKYNKNQFCAYCKFVYYKEDLDSKPKSFWLNCRTCHRYVHHDCESRHGTEHPAAAINQSNYKCPSCRGINIPGKV